METNEWLAMLVANLCGLYEGPNLTALEFQGPSEETEGYGMAATNRNARKSS